jgi:hypothetical protein
MPENVKKNCFGATRTVFEDGCSVAGVHRRVVEQFKFAKYIKLHMSLFQKETFLLIFVTNSVAVFLSVEIESDTFCQGTAQLYSLQ